MTKIQSTSNLTPEQSVGAWVTTDYRLAALFEHYGIDFCCGGNKPLDQACAEQNVSLETILQEAQQVTAAPATGEQYDHWALDFLADYIVNQFHAANRQTMPQITDYAATVAEVHGVAHPETVAIAAIWPQVQGEMGMHMQREELLVFPYIKRLVRSQEEGTAPKPLPTGSLRDLLETLEAEHDATGDALAELARLTGGYTQPDDACPTYRTLYALLEQFDASTKKHVHLENNILFLKTMRLEETLLQAEPA
jgi:regulator of cell morphogenesis and NO signaling